VVCAPPASIVAFLASELGTVLTYYGAWVWLMARSGRLLRLRPWQEYRTANMIFRLECARFEVHACTGGGVASCTKHAGE
jgi:hypothetical protein